MLKDQTIKNQIVRHPVNDGGSDFMMDLPVLSLMPCR